MSHQKDSNIVTHALEKMASTARKPKKKSLKSIIIEQTAQIEGARAQGWTYEEIAREMERATKEAHPDEPEKWVIIAPSSLRKYLYQARKRQQASSSSLPNNAQNHHNFLI